MRHRKAGKKLGRTPAHRLALFDNLLQSLFEHERIQTTDVKAKELKRQAERVITLCKKGTLAARRLVAQRIRQPAILRKLFDELAPRFASRPGGYARIMKLGNRLGDAAPISIIELLGEDEAVAPRRRSAAADGEGAAVTTKESFGQAGE
jgi:large subunit ribosomal protein L17